MIDRYEIFEKAIDSSSEEADKHLIEFFKAFMPKQRNERWIHLAKKRSSRAHRDSHKLSGLLNFGLATKITNASNLGKYSDGVYWDFIDNPIITTPREAFVLGDYQDGIYSLIPGKLAIFFFHEGDIWLFKS